jgi:hypothetical protein
MLPRVFGMHALPLERPNILYDLTQTVMTSGKTAPMKKMGARSNAKRMAISAAMNRSQESPVGRVNHPVSPRSSNMMILVAEVALFSVDYQVLT